MFTNNMLLFPLSFSGNFCGGQGLDGRGQSRDGGVPTGENPDFGNSFLFLLAGNVTATIPVDRRRCV